MRLLHTTTFQLKFFIPEQAPDYVILSHRWSVEEVVFEDFLIGDLLSPEHTARNKAGFQKIVGACSLAAKDQYDWIWIDSCCIDKSSSAILQESINSMWGYYSNANICYVYMADVPDEVAGWTAQYSESEWFNRGWTLQELIAPFLVEFYAKDWSPIGTKIKRCEEIARITYINKDILLDPNLVDGESAANRMSWVGHRQVTREEDQAYSLLGLFQVNMPMLYGEGREKAFGRLQEAIYNATRDDSLFLFRYSPYPDRLPLLSDSPLRFCPLVECQSCKSTCIECLQLETKTEDIIASGAWSTQAHEHILTTITQFRFEASTTLLLLDLSNVPQNLLSASDFDIHGASHLAILNQTLIREPDGALCLALQRSSDDGDAAIRMNKFPIQIRNWKTLLLQAQMTKILIPLQLNPTPQESPITMEFEAKANSFAVYAWKAKSSTKTAISSHESPNSSFSIRCASLKTQPREIQCYLSATFDNNLKVVITLKRTGTIWLIKSVAVPTQKGYRSRKDLDHRTLKSEDRCTFRLANNADIKIAIRRMATSRPATVGRKAHIKTQIEILA